MRKPGVGRKPKPRALRHLAAEQLGLVIQEGEHSPVDDARAALYIYQKHRKVCHPPACQLHLRRVYLRWILELSYKAGYT